jgi:AhpD family alkylhydroperoxidase
MNDQSETGKPRLPYDKLAPEAYAKLIALGHYLNTATALEPSLLGFIYLRASILNNCSFCKGLHTKELKHQNEPETRIAAVAEWQASDAFTPRERAALAWTDTVTRLGGQEIPDDAYAAVSAFFHDKDLADLTFAIANINAWNRLGVAFGLKWAPPGGTR